ncbi:MULTISPECIES: hypothetical protein [unclassified Mesorhizobium]|uniref:hypothetical protein n=1 Tax=unclassified Mesorhizobium TaxID=325217 RepID=UPI0003FA0FF0|nr:MULTISPECIES: hypothetical protein [unclassified Mesorhizobium]WJI79366.1 hypothetical protein NLY34_21150 [Mesorhizobium sp. C374B]WJI85902.1 hypothetical protein NLY42_23550 [Mesorhizobium sp. C372A]
MSKTFTALIRMTFTFICLVGLASSVSILFPATASAQRMQKCADEGEICRLPYPSEVVYGARGQTTSRFIDRRAVPCTNRVFGDPAPGRDKACYIVKRGGGNDYGDNDDDGDNYGDDDYGQGRGRWVACARENQFCDFRGRQVVRYGARGRFTQGVFRNGVRCGNDAFDEDPAPRAKKTCYIRK